MVVRGDRLARVPGDAVTITTLRDAAGFLGLTLTDDPGVGHDLPPYAPDADLRAVSYTHLTLPTILRV